MLRRARDSGLRRARSALTSGRGLLQALALGAIALHAAAAAPQGTTFTVSFPAARSGQPLDGRVILLLSRDFTREPVNLFRA